MMAPLTICFATNLLLFISAARAIEFFQTVKGKCSDLPTVQEYDFRKMATGEWYFHSVSFGKNGDQCATGRGVTRGLMNYGSLLFFDSKTNHYVNVPVDLTYNPDKPGTYSSSLGGVGQVVAIDSDENNVMVHCLEEGGQTKVLTVLGTRSPKLGNEAERFYKGVIKKLKKLNLVPKVHLVPQYHCPPLKDIQYL